MVNKAAVAISVVAVIGLVLVFLVVIVWAWLESRSPDPSSEIVPLTSPVGLLYQCRDFECVDGTSCDSQTGICKRDVGRPCDRASDCLIGAYCSGICVNTDPGVLTGLSNDPCPCGNNMQCVGEDNARICKLIEGQPCINGSDCLSGRCNNSACSAGLANGVVCTANSQCVNDNCSLGFCQDPGVETGTRNAVCSSSGASCNTGLSCIDGFCISATSGISEACNTTSTACINPLLCYTVPQIGAQGQPPPWDPAVPCYDITGEEVVCQCNYPFQNQQPDPNDCSDNQTCTTPYVCSSNNCLGLGNAGVPCSADSQCANTCGSQPTVIRLVYTKFNSNRTDTIQGSTVDDFFSSFDVTYTVLNTVFANANRLTGADDNIFYVVPGDGVYRVSDNFMMIDGDQSVTSGNVTTERSLVDAQMYGPNSGFAVFDETITTTSGGSVTVISGKTVYQLLNGSLTPFNIISNPNFPDGVQYTSDNNNIDIDNLQYEPISQNLGLQDVGGKFWYLDGTTYRAMLDTGTGSEFGALDLPQYYFDGFNNDPVGTCTATCPAVTNISYLIPKDTSLLVGFNGNANGALYPVNLDLGVITGDSYSVIKYSIYTPQDAGLAGGSGVSLIQGPSRITLYVGPPTSSNTIPGYFDGSELVLATSTGIYLYVNGTCN